MRKTNPETEGENRDGMFDTGIGGIMHSGAFRAGKLVKSGHISSRTYLLFSKCQAMSSYLLESPNPVKLEKSF